MTVVVDEVGPHRDPHCRSDRRDAADRADCLPRLHLVAVARGRGRSTSASWILGTEEEWGRGGRSTTTTTSACSDPCSTGRRDLFPRAAELPAGPAAEDAALVTCAYLTDPSKPWVMQSLFLTAIGDAREKGAAALETFAYRYERRATSRGRFQVHKTIFPSDFLADFGFRTIRRQGRVELARLELGGLQPVVEGKREKVCRSCATPSCRRRRQSFPSEPLVQGRRSGRRGRT